MTAAASQLDNLDLTDSDTASVEGSRTFDDPDGSADGSSSAVDMLPPRPTSSSGIDTPALTDHDAATSAASASEVQTLDAEPALEWQIPLPIPVAGQIPATHHERSMPISDWAATQKPGWELEWDVSEYTICQPMSFLEPILGGGVRDAEWAVAAEQEAIMRIGPVGDAAAGLPGVSGHFLLGNAAHSLAPVILEYWEPVPAPFAEPIGTVADEAYLPSTAGGGAKRLVVWMESTVVTAKQIKPGMGGVFELKWVRRRGQAFWFVDKVHVCFSDVSLRSSGRDCRESLTDACSSGPHSFGSPPLRFTAATTRTDWLTSPIGPISAPLSVRRPRATPSSHAVPRHLFTTTHHASSCCGAPDLLHAPTLSLSCAASSDDQSVLPKLLPAIRMSSSTST